LSDSPSAARIKHASRNLPVLKCYRFSAYTLLKNQASLVELAENMLPNMAA
jgi:hypothetical protein